MFGTEEEYAAFLRPRLRPGTRLVAVAGDRRGDRGPFVKDGGPCLPKSWALGNSFWFPDTCSSDDSYGGDSSDSSDDRPCKVRWETRGSSSWVNWCDVALEVRVAAHTLCALRGL